MLCTCASRSAKSGGADRDRTDDPLLAKQVLSQLSYSPVVGLGGLEPPTSPLSGARSNHLSYRPVDRLNAQRRSQPSRPRPQALFFYCAGVLCGRLGMVPSRSRKEVIQPHLPIRLPCYDFTPVIDHSVASALLSVRLPASGATNSHGVTGGVYKARERIHRDNADSRLLAIPTSRSRVADCDPD
jgi:hypothetical protein